MPYEVLDTAGELGLGDGLATRHAAHVRALGLLAIAACASTQHAAAPRVGAIAGLVRDHDSGDPIANAEIRLRARGELGRARLVVSGSDGHYALERVAPGRYSIAASFAGQPIDVENIDVHAGDTEVVDLVFTLGRPDPIAIDFGDPKEGAIEHYRPSRLAADAAILEGAVSDSGTRARVSGAVVTVEGPGDSPGVRQMVSDDQGRFRFEVQPGTYRVSAYYSIEGRGQIEVRRSAIRVGGAEAAIVPLWIELAKQ
jgi:hypothetical protein